MPIGYYYDVITNGFATMPDHAGQVPPADRWAIAAYVRVLQYSEYAPVAEIPAERRPQLEASVGARTGGAPAMSAEALPMPETLGRIERPALVAAGVFLLATALGLVLDSEQFLRSWLPGLPVLAGPRGGLARPRAAEPTHGGLWGIVPRRLHEAAARTILLAIAVLPLLVGAQHSTSLGRSRGGDGREPAVRRPPT